jgi:hypothetical protein
VKTYLLAIIFICFSSQLHAYCEGGKYPNISVSDEIKQTSFIIIGTVTQRLLVVDPINDPEGYEAELFHVKVERILYGKPPVYITDQYLTLYNFNASSRYLMEVGEKHLLFVSANQDGFRINSCGNSTDSIEIKTIQTIKELVGGNDA